MVKPLIVIDRLCQNHIFVHEDDGEDLTRCACVVA